MDSAAGHSADKEHTDLCASRVGADGGLHVGQAVSVADLGDLSGVVVPMEIEHRTNVRRQGDLVGPHELLEQGDLRLASKIGLGEGFEVAEDVAALGLERLPELG